MNVGNRIDALITEERWEEAGDVIASALVHEPGRHWLLTQCGVTLYERRRYRESLTLFAASRVLSPECPQTIWNPGGALDALGEPDKAVACFAWLVRCRRTADDDSCWEAPDWTLRLKADCVYRLGLCFEAFGLDGAATDCLRRYLGLLAAGVPGMYRAKDAIRHLSRTRGPSDATTVRTITATSEEVLALKAVRDRGTKLPRVDVEG